jgi:uncharacterized protein YyaL (SSP411 family)
VHRLKSGRNILHLSIPLEESARSMQCTEGELNQMLERILKKLYSAREARIHPHLDDKILTDWNGLMIAALARAAQILGESAFIPAAYTFFLSSVDFSIGPGAQIVIVGERGRKDSEEMIRALRRSYIPNKVLVYKSGKGDQQRLERIVPFIKEHRSVDGKATCYICCDFSCSQPTTDSTRVLEILKEMGI